MRDSRYLAANEQMVVQVRLHWVVLARVILETVAVLVGVLAVSIFFAARDVGPRSFVALLWWVALAAVVRLLWRLLDWHRTYLLITSSRLVKASGIVSTKVQAIPLSKITDLAYNQDLNSRMLGYGEFVMETEGDHTSDLEKIDHVPVPDRFYLLLCNSIFGGGPGPAADD